MDLPYLSLTNHFYYKLLSPYRLFATGIFHDLLHEKELEMKLEEDKTLYYHGTTTLSDNDRIVMANIDRLKELKDSVIKFKDIDIGTFHFSKLYDYLPSSYDVWLSAHPSDHATIDWESIDGSVLHRITKLSLSVVQDTLTIVHQLGRLTGLKSLIIQFGNPYDWQQVMFAIQNSKVEYLQIDGHAVNCKVFAHNLHLTGLHTLRLNNCHINDDMVVYLANALPDSTLKIFELADNNIADRGAATLASMVRKSKLSSLNLNGNDITAVGLHSLCDSLPFCTLKELQIGGNRFEEEEMYYFYEKLPNSQIDYIMFRNLKAVPKEALIANIGKSNVQRMNVSISLKNMGRLLQAIQGSKVKSLLLRFEKDVDTGMEILSRYLPSCTLEELLIENALGIGITNSSLIFTSLSGNKYLKFLAICEVEFCRNQVQVISDYLQYTNLTSLRICSTNISDEELEVLIPGILSSSLMNLNLSGNYEITLPGISHFIEGIKHSKLRNLAVPNQFEIMAKEFNREVREILGDHSLLRVEVH
ncbi:hypothetical protein HK103_006280 [Boothiomyces macroporosus]|uniref:Uncharacterized protein n=1 Tax=Boothiomyces macroporosus TaxID=261099 RepID=A0AAD5Y6T5_9FUNG|nr:hypothetical protein HK103_006280 [Boothiomyces macroporosus]